MGRMRNLLGRRRIVVGAVVVVVAAAVLAGVELGGNGAPPTGKGGEATSTTTVKTADLAETTPVNGTIGFAGSYTIVQPSGNPGTTLTRDQQSVQAAQSAVSADQSSMTASEADDQSSLSQAQAGLQSAQATLATDQQGLQNDQSTLAADQQKEASDCQGDASAGSAGSSGSSGAGSGGSGGGGGSACSTDQSRVGADQAKVSQDQQAVAKDQTQVGSARSQLSAARQKQAQDQTQAQSKLSADQQSLSAADQTLGQDSAAATSYGPDSAYTALPAVGQVIRPGESLWSVNGEPTLLLPGVATPWRAFAAGMSPGPDVAALDGALAQLGFGSGLAGSDSFTSATAAAIDRLQAHSGLSQTGALLLGSVVFSPSPLRVTAVHPLVGAGVGGGQPVLDVTSTTPVVNVALPVNQSYLVSTGDRVSVNLPDGSTAEGTITGVGSVATSTSNSGNNGGNGGNDQPSATVNVTVALSRAGPAGSLDQAPVTVNITSQSVSNVLAVPTTALLALAGGGYALEVVGADGVHHLEAVTTGLFDDASGLVQVSGPGVSAGQTIVVPGS